ncbi:MAG: hypothetical protein ACK4VZ_15810 [Paracoccaceae bacterium]
MSIYEQMHDAIKSFENACEVIVIGANDATGSARWRIPETRTTVLRFDALAAPGSDIKRAVVHVHAGILTFFEVQTSETPPADWIRGISSLRPQSNAQNLRSGSRSDRHFIAKHTVPHPMPLTQVSTLGSPGVPKFFLIDIEGMDYDVTLSLFARPDIIGIGCEHALMSSDEVILLRCAAIENGFDFEFGEEDAVFLRQTR